MKQESDGDSEIGPGLSAPYIMPGSSTRGKTQSVILYPFILLQIVGS